MFFDGDCSDPGCAGGTCGDDDAAAPADPAAPVEGAPAEPEAPTEEAPAEEASPA